MVWAVVWAPAPDQTRPFAAAGKKNLGDRTVKVKARRTSAVICALPLRWCIESLSRAPQTARTRTVVLAYESVTILDDVNISVE